MAEIIKLYKNVGETPLECILRFKESNPKYADTKMTYLGRLDPMAEGLLLVLAGNTRDRDKYLNMDKTYEFEVLWGFETDTYDVLGLVTHISHGINVSEGTIKDVVRRIKSKRQQSYPPYSSRPVAGKPLWEWSRDNKIEEVEIPARSIKIFSLEHVHTRLVPHTEILGNVAGRIGLVQGDFRQAQIIEAWRDALDPEEKSLISGFRADVSSGTYIRSLAHEMGKLAGTSALAYSIRRTRVGEYEL